MISIELAQKLKEAGLEWKPQQGDCYTYEPQTVRTFSKNAGHPPVITIYSECYTLNHACAVRRCDLLKPSHFLWLPKLEQLLEEIKARGWEAAVKTAEGAAAGPASAIEPAAELGADPKADQESAAVESAAVNTPGESTAGERAGENTTEERAAGECAGERSGECAEERAGEHEQSFLCFLFKEGEEHVFRGSSAEEAAGQALLWLLGGNPRKTA